MKVSELKKARFQSLDLSEKLFIKMNGRPVPELDLSQVQAECKSRNAFTRKFDVSLYEKTPWLCGCEETNALFCFPCLLFGGEPECFPDTWAFAGMKDLKHLPARMKSHESTIRHKENMVSLTLLGRFEKELVHTVEPLSETIQKHNDKVFKNRISLTKLIDVLILGGTLNLSISGIDDKTENPLNNNGEPHVVSNLIDYSCFIDPALNYYFENAQELKVLSKSTVDELLECMHKVCKEYIANEIQRAPYVALIAHDMTDLSTKAQTVLVLRYIVDDKLKERFWTFLTPETEDAEGYAKAILEELDPLLGTCPEKLVSQSYDGSSLFRGSCSEDSVHSRIREVYNDAHYVPCYAHPLDKLIGQATSHDPSIRIFFGILYGIADFFINHPERVAALNNLLENRKMSCVWNLRSRLIQTIWGNIKLILQCFENIQSGTPTLYNTETMCLAAGYIKWLTDDIFLFWLNFFNDLMLQIDLLQKSQTDLKNLGKAVKAFESGIQIIRNKMTLEEMQRQDGGEPPSKKRRDIMREKLILAAKMICDRIIIQIKDRFDFKGHLFGEELFVKKRFSDFRKANFGKEIVAEFCGAFPLVDEQDLTTELQVFYKRPEFITINGVYKSFNYFVSTALNIEVFKEISNALSLLLTVPLPTQERERCLPTTDKLKDFLKGFQGDNLTARCMLSLEWAMVKEVSEFTAKVIEKFCSTGHRAMFNFK